MPIYSNKCRAIPVFFNLISSFCYYAFWAEHGTKWISIMKYVRELIYRFDNLTKLDIPAAASGMFRWHKQNIPVGMVFSFSLSLSFLFFLDSKSFSKISARNNMTE